MDTNLTTKTAYQMYMTLIDTEGEDRANEWLVRNLSDDEIEAVEKYASMVERRNRRNWHIQDFVHLG